ncbi:MAG: hypothetical protein E7314_07615 [Clostridiales bacterium]|nr:hypothetical protein [Clostridiales bacterium]
MRRTNCFTASCEYCKKSVKAGENLEGYQLYTCCAYPKKHKKIYADECNAFRCNRVGSKDVLCLDCRKGR